jgi:hypothetical protein
MKYKYVYREVTNFIATVFFKYVGYFEKYKDKLFLFLMYDIYGAISLQ